MTFLKGASRSFWVQRLALLAGLAASLSAADKTTTIRLEPSNDHRVKIVHAGYEAEWRFRLPVGVSANEGSFLNHTRTPMEWRQFHESTIGYDWEPSEEYARESSEKTKGRQKMIVGMRISPRMRVGSDRIELRMDLKNVSDRPFQAVWSGGGCLTHLTERFIDRNYDHSYMFTESGLTPLHKTDRSVPIRAVYFFNSVWYEHPSIKAYGYFWGPSRTRPTAVLMMSEALEGKGAVGIAWDQSIGVRQNSDEHHHCMHSSPYFGKIGPGETVSRRGVILFADTVQEVAQKFELEKLVPYRGAPGDDSK